MLLPYWLEINSLYPISTPKIYNLLFPNITFSGSGSLSTNCLAGICWAPSELTLIINICGIMFPFSLSILFSKCLETCSMIPSIGFVLFESISVFLLPVWPSLGILEGDKNSLPDLALLLNKISEFIMPGFFPLPNELLLPRWLKLNLVFLPGVS